MIFEKYAMALRSNRLLLKLTQKEVSQLAKISRNYYSEIENGKSKPSFEVVERLNKVIPIIFLIEEVDNTLHSEEVI